MTEEGDDVVQPFKEQTSSKIIKNMAPPGSQQPADSFQTNTGTGNMFK